MPNHIHSLIGIVNPVGNGLDRSANAIDTSSIDGGRVEPRPYTVHILTIPLILVGAVLAMLVMKADFGFMVILGLLSLAGSIVNNGIVLIDRIETYRNEGMEPYTAIVKTCINRLRPIFLSVSTTALGVITLIVPYNPLFYGMASVLMFGLLIGTLFTLGFVPVLYSIFFRVNTPAGNARAK